MPLSFMSRATVVWLSLAIFSSASPLRTLYTVVRAAFGAAGVADRAVLFAAPGRRRTWPALSLRASVMPLSFMSASAVVLLRVAISPIVSLAWTL